MRAKYPLALHIFRRDLRLQDNTALINALAASESVIPCFIFDKRQIEKNDYKSDNCIQFMLQSLHSLDAELRQKNSRLYLFYGIAEEVIASLIAKLNVNAVYINRDYTPFSKERDRQIEKVCREHKIDFYCFADSMLHEPEETLKTDKTPYTVFTPYFKNASQLLVAAPLKNNHSNYYQKDILFTDKHTLALLSRKQNANLLVKGGRKEALALLKHATTLENYAESRDIPALNGTTKLSAHNKFGTISIREVYAGLVKTFSNTHTLIRELYWRDFFTHIAFYFPHVIGHAFHQKYNHITWANNEKYFRAWCDGRTGFPIVDAGMRELNTTGYMHNRVRMITASFLVKDLHIDWRWGEKYFAQKLVDYDPAVNNGNWQWAASTGCDAQPYFRIFNPWLQQQKFDPECLYIKRWIIELSHTNPRDIHALEKQPSASLANYPTAIIDHRVESQKTKLLFQV